MTTPDPIESTAAVPMSPVVVLGLTQQVDELVEKLDVMEERRRLDRRLWIVGIGVVASLTLFSVVLVAAVLMIGSSNQAGVNAIESCTTPGGECYERSRASTAGTLQLLLEQDIIIADCSRRTQTRPQLEACVELEMRNR